MPRRRKTTRGIENFEVSVNMMRRWYVKHIPTSLCLRKDGTFNANVSHSNSLMRGNWADKESAMACLQEFINTRKEVRQSDVF